MDGRAAHSRGVMDAMETGFEPMDEFHARQRGALELAYVGDCVYECCVRTRLVMRGGGRMKALHRAAVSQVRAAYQAAALRRLEPALRPLEADVCRRARNASPGSTPKHASHEDYHAATALEALVGYLYLSGQWARLEELMGLALDAPGGNE